jgi:hypothetical protein
LKKGAINQEIFKYISWRDVFGPFTIFSSPWTNHL